MEGSQSTIGGGGRYDDLIEELGGKPTPADYAGALERAIVEVIGHESGHIGPERPLTPGAVPFLGEPQAETKAKETLTALIAKDKAEEGNAQAVIGLNRLAHYHRDLGKLCNNFVNFRDFYGRKTRAIFQAGTAIGKFHGVIRPTTPMG